MIMCHLCEKDAADSQGPCVLSRLYLGGDELYQLCVLAHNVMTIKCMLVEWV